MFRSASVGTVAVGGSLDEMLVLERAHWRLEAAYIGVGVALGGAAKTTTFDPWGDLLSLFAMRLGGGSGVSELSGSFTAALWESDEAPAKASVSSSVFFSLSFASRPSTLFNRASKTSVLGPRFLGTASGEG